MKQNFIISWFRREAGLLFFTNKIKMILACMLVCLGLCGNCLEVLAEDGAAALDESSDIVVVLDPGHGGDDQGGQYEDYDEKDMTLIVAKAMEEELNKYEGIKVYLTRTNDRAMTLQERADYAQSVGADFLFCLHFNTSLNHTLFGAETWISAFGEEYSRGYAFANIEMELLQEQGLYSRGIKTRLNDHGTDYYGIIRHSTEYGFPCVLIEHCHLDQENDQPFYDHNEKLKDFGKLDAEAVAKYYGLKSDVLGKDYSDYKNIEVAAPIQAVKPDSTGPDVCIIELVEQNKKNGDVTLSLSAADYDSGMLYYTYSYDGGATFSELQRWPDKSRDTFEFTFNVPSGVIPQVVVNAYNGYDLYTTSNALGLASASYESKAESDPFGDENETEADELDAVESETEESGLDENEGGTDKFGVSGNMSDAMETSSGGILSEDSISRKLTELVNDAGERKPATIVYFVKVCLICVIIVLLMIWSILLVIKRQKKKRKRRSGK